MGQYRLSNSGIVNYYILLCQFSYLGIKVLEEKSNKNKIIYTENSYILHKQTILLRDRCEILFQYRRRPQSLSVGKRL